MDLSEPIKRTRRYLDSLDAAVAKLPDIRGVDTEEIGRCISGIRTYVDDIAEQVGYDDDDESQVITLLWVVDACPDANGHATVRLADGSRNGNTEEEPVATVYDWDAAEHLVELHNRSLGK